MPEAAGEYADIPALLKGILNGYPGNSAIFREYLQNSDDAGASSQIFILDERTFSHNSILDPVLSDSQGPALVCINNGILEQADWKALQSIHSSSKVADETRTGKNGLGFRASYHLTENPHLFSGRKLLVLDAHRHFQKHPGGVSIDVIDEGAEYEDQMTPFTSLIDHPREFFSGTLFRLPLRTEAQAERSRIKDTPTSPEEILELLRGFCQTELEEVILFLKHVTNIEVRHISKEGVNNLLGRVVVQRPQLEPIHGTYHCRINLTRQDGVETTREWCFYHLSVEKSEAKRMLSSRLGYDVGDKLLIEKLTPVVDLAFPIDGPTIKSKLYTLLPLPITTDFHMHINAVFALTPDRQNLKNALEIGVQRSRERLLVEWNKVLFTAWIPIAWARLLADLRKSFVTHNSVNSYWSLWPPLEPTGNTYWGGLSKGVLIEIIRCAIPAFPIFGEALVDILYVSLKNSNILLAPPDASIDLNILSSHVDIVQPPGYIYDILYELRSQMTASFLSPDTLYRRIREVYTADRFPICTPEHARTIVDYLAQVNTVPTLTFIPGIRLFRLTDGSHVSLGSVSANYIVPSSQREAELFGSHRLMLDWNCMSDRFRKYVITAGTASRLNTTTLKVDHIFAVLHASFNSLKPPLRQIKVEDFAWLTNFWNWVAHWPDVKSFFKKEKSEKLANLYLLPTSERSLRKFSSKSFVFGDTDQAAVDAWNMLGVYPLHSDILNDVSLKMKPVVERPQSTDFVPLLLRTCNTSLQKNISQDALLAIQKSICLCLPSRATPFKLPRNERLKLCALKIFATRSTDNEAWSLNSLEGTSEFRYLNVMNQFLLPVERHSVVYVNMQDPSTSLLARLANETLPRTYSEIDLVKIAFDNWNIQAPNVQDTYVAWIFRNRASVSHDILRRMDNLEFVKAHRTEHKVKPVGLVNPGSTIASLYTDEPGRLPTDLFATKYLPVMQDLGYLHSHLDAFVVEERLKYLSSNSSDVSRARKAKDFIALCNREWKPEFEPMIQGTCDQTWMPVDDSTFESPAFCRDSIGTRGTHENPFFYDLTLKILPLDVQIIAPPFRKALGWSDVIPSQILVTQFRLTLQLDDNQEQNSRLIALIDYFGYLNDQGRLSLDTVKDVKDMLTDKAWIPATSSRDGGLVKASYALFSHNIDLKPPFRQVHNFELTPFLVKTGCTLRPTLEVLEEELRSQEYVCDQDVAASVSILQEIVTYHPDFDRATLCIPGTNNSSIPLENAFFKDTRLTNFASSATGLLPAHDMISRALADSLHIPCSSALNFESFAADDEEADEDNDAQMGEDFVTRIRGFLREYDVRYALNEFLANADDAGATRFSILVDTPTVNGDGYLSPELESLISCPSLILYNNASMKEEDFEGLLKIGRGGKHGTSETHGRHGLGALSFYYFTDVVTVISGGQIMFLDPSGMYLPRRRYEKRTGLRKPLVQFSLQYLDQLKSYDSIFGFSPFSSNYEGTLFILPLRSSISEQPCGLVETHDLLKTTYQSLSENAFFFTHLTRISAEEKRSSENVKLWSMSASRTLPVTLNEDFMRSDLSIERIEEDRQPIVQTWLVATSPRAQIPNEHEVTAKMLKLDPESVMNVQIAIRTGLRDYSDCKSFLFSTLSLPKVVSLPFHLNSRFSISSNRQSVVLDPRDSDHQVDAKTAYNLWILESLVPPLYLAAFEFLLHTYNQEYHFYKRRWWLLDTSDDISNIVQKAFLSMLPASDSRILQDSVNGPSWVSFMDATFSADEPLPVTTILTHLAPSGIVIPTNLEELSKLPSVRTINPIFTKTILLGQGALGMLRDALKEKVISNRDIAKMLDYVHKEVPVAGLPLMVLSPSKLIKIPGQSDPPVYRSKSSHATLFFSTAFLMGATYTEDTLLTIFKDATNNVLELTPERMVPLIEHTMGSLNVVQLNEWVTRFWEVYADLPGPPSLGSLEKEALKLVKGSSGYVSLVNCTPCDAAFDGQAVMERRPLLAILQKLGISVLMPANNIILTDYLETKFAALIANVLLCIQSVGLSKIKNQLDVTEQQILARWIRTSIVSPIAYGEGFPEVDKAFLMALPIWKAQNHLGPILHACTGLKLIPVHVDIRHILPFQRTGCVVAEKAYDVTQVHNFCLRYELKTVSPKAMMDIVVDIPPQFDAENAELLNSYKNFLQDMFKYPRNELQHAVLPIPDQGGTMRRISDLFDDTIDLFATSLAQTDRSSFPHPILRPIYEDLYNLGLKYALDLPNFKACASAMAARILYQI